jgi:predicted RNA-binding protein YlxR (DUF448 family)
MKPKRELIRVVRSPEGAVSIDLRGKASGRGAYVCGGSAACLKRAVKSRALSRALGVPVPDEITARLEAEVLKAGDGGDE